MVATRRNALVLAAIGCVLLGSIWSPLTGEARWTDEVSTAGHGLTFALTALLAAAALQAGRTTQSWPLWRQYGAALAFAVLLGFATEVLQIWLPRAADLEDLRADVLGAWTGLAAFALFDSRLRTAIRLVLPASGLVPLLVLGIPLALCAQAYARREAAFPSLADYRERFDDYFLQAQGTSRTHSPMPDPWAAYPGELAMHIRFGKSAWPGLHFAEPSPDWQGYATLALDVTNPNPAALPLSIRIHDSLHNEQYSDRFNALVELAPRERRIVRLPVIDIARGPRSRELDLTRISGLILFVSGEASAEEIGEGLFVSRIWLE